MAKVIDKKLLHRGYIYVRSGAPIPGKNTYWECKLKRRAKSCTARATTAPGDVVTVLKFGKHSHPPDHEECRAEEVLESMKRQAANNPEQGPSAIIRDELRNVPVEVVARLPERRNIKKAVRRVRRVELPPNPTRITDLGELPDRFRLTLQGERFLILDNGDDAQRVLAFATRRNLEVLARSAMWFLDGTFSV